MKIQWTVASSSGMLNASNKQMLSHRCNQLQNAITRSGVFSALATISVVVLSHGGPAMTVIKQCTLIRFLGQCTLGNGHTQ